MPVSDNASNTTLKLALPKGRMQEGVLGLLADAGIRVRVGTRGYRPQVSLQGVDAKILKPQNVVEMLQSGSRDVGFAGADWVSELGAELTELLDTGLDGVRVVAAAPAGMLENGRLRALEGGTLIVASEYEQLTRRWIRSRELGATFVRSYGATEAFPPDDADCVVDVTATGDTLRAHNLEIFDELMTSSTRLYANPASLRDPVRREAIERFVLLVRSALDARGRVMVEVNVGPEALESVVAALPCMREPTISTLHGSNGYAVKAAMRKEQLPVVIPIIKARGGTDIVVTQLSQIIP